MTWRDRRTGFYPFRLTQERSAEGEKWTAEHPSLPGCVVIRRSATAALQALSEARREWIARALRFGDEIPDAEMDLKYELTMDPDHTAAEIQQADQAIADAASVTEAEDIPVHCFR